MRVDPDSRNYFEIGDRPDLSYTEKLDLYDSMSNEYFDTAEYHEFCHEHLEHLDDLMLEYVESPHFDSLLVETVRATFPAHEHDHFIEHYRGLLRAWTDDQHAIKPAG
jgi:hypothetical protein